LVVAETVEIARAAVHAIKVDIDPLPIITDPRVAHAAGEIIGTPRIFAIGDVDAAWEQCDVVVEGRSDVGGQEHLYLETMRARAIPGEEGRVSILSSTQSPYAVQRATAKILGVANHLVEVDVKRLGGGFGGKEDQATAWGCMAGLAAILTRRAVQLVLHRLDDLRMTGKRHPFSADFKLGAKADGTLMAYQVTHYQNAGAACDLSLAVLERSLFHSTAAYHVPNVHAYGASCRTNLPPNTAFRGFGGPQGMFAIECAIAELADTLGVPREEIQKKNLVKDGDQFHYGQIASRTKAIPTWEECEDGFDLASLRAEIDAHNASNVMFKQGFAMMPVCFGIAFTATFLNQASALVHVYTDGSISVSTGGVEMGQGLTTKLRTIAASALGVSESRIRVESTNTTRIANMSPSAASATTDLNGGATIKAMNDIRGRLFELVAPALNVDPSEVDLVDGQVLARGKKTDWTWEKLVSHAYLSRVALSAHAFYATPDIHFDKTTEKGSPFSYHVFGTAAFKVTIDVLRGRYTIDSARVVHDLGRPLNELVDLGQVEGGLAQGLGWMTMEELEYGDDGRLLSHALSTYKAPDGYSMPSDLQVRFLEDENPSGPYGSKAVGEPPLMYGIGVYFALRDALRAAAPKRKFRYHAPMTPERVLMNLHAEKLATRGPSEKLATRGNAEATE
jgi:xanthine dehydrogenase large subunit